jgi:hypothetical protein
VGENRSAYKVLAGKSGKKRPLGRYKRSWLDSIKVDLERNCVGLDSRAVGYGIIAYSF